jgi:hypothetical protein
MKTGDIISFLNGIWKNQCNKGEYVFIATRDPKNPRSWKDHPLQFGPNLRSQLRDVLRQYSSDKYDLYWCPLPFSGPKRDKELVKRSNYLWQDLDYANPKDFPNLKPTIYWESSPDRFHGLWQLDQVYDISQVENLNRDLAYHVGADKGGWDLTQVLRIPGTRNHKYKEKPEVEFRLQDGKPYQLKNLRKSIPEIKRVEIDSIGKLQEGDPKSILKEWSPKLSKKILSMLLIETAPVGERSDKIWFIENKLYEAGMTPEEIFTLIKNSAWNKYRGRHDEDERLQSEMEKIISQTVDKAQNPDKSRLSDIDLSEIGQSLLIESYQDVMGKMNSYPGWLVEGFWARRSHGIVAGEPKSFKSTYVVDLMLAVASGEPFLGKYPVLEPGPVIYVQNENADWIIKDKIQKVIANRNLAGSYRRKGNRKIEIKFPKDLPFHFINQQGYQLDDPTHQAILEELVKQIKPVLVVFDPLYLMFSGDVNSAKDLNPVLQWMLHLKNTYKTGVIAIHHYNKGGSGNWRGGQRMLGSTTLHGWIESAWYLQRNEPEEDDEAEISKQSNKPSKVILDREFRNGGQFPKLELSLLMGEVGNPVYKVDTEVYKEEGKKGNERRKKTPDELANEILEIVNQSSFDIVSWDKIKDITGVGDKMIQSAVDIMLTANPHLQRVKLGIKKDQ